MSDGYTVGEDDPIFLDDVLLAAHLYRTATAPLARRQKKAYRDRLIRQCWEGGDVTRKQLAAAAHLSVQTIDAIRRAGRGPRPGPELRVIEGGKRPGE
jgi:hypothetical protein